MSIKDILRRPGDVKPVNVESVLAVNNRARQCIKDYREGTLRGDINWNMDQRAELSRIGRPGGCTFTKENIAPKK